MKDLVIVGIGGFGREAYYLAKAINKHNPTWNIKGFIGNVGDDPKQFKIDLPMLGIIEDYVPQENEVFAMGISAPKTKEKLTQLLKSKGAVFATLIGPTAYVSENVELGEGVVFTSGSIGACSKIGNFVHIAGSMIGQDAVIGDYSTTTGFANLTNAIIGKRVFIGSHAVILNKKKIGDDAYVCAGSIVFNNVKPGVKVMGNPARKFEI